MHCTNHECSFRTFPAAGVLPEAMESGCAIGDCVHFVEFRQGEVLFMQGQPSTNVYALTEGMVKICNHTADGREQIIGLSSPNNLMVGLQSLNDERYAYTAIAATSVKACRINHRNLLARARTDGDVAIKLIDAFNAQLAHSRALMEVMGHRCAAAKIAAFILRMAPRLKNGTCDISMPFSRIELAGLLGLSEETVCRVMAMMKREGAIYAPRGHIEIRDWERLQATVEKCCAGQVMP